MDNMTHREKIALQLEEVENAIHAVLVGGQEYRIGSRSLTRADITRLYQMKKELQGELAEEDGLLMDDTYVAVFDRR